MHLLCRSHSEFGRFCRPYLRQSHPCHVPGELPCISLIACGPVSYSDGLPSLCQLAVFLEDSYTFLAEVRYVSSGCSDEQARANNILVTTSNSQQQTLNGHQGSVSPGYPRIESSS